MKGANEHKNNITHRLVNPALRPQQDKEKSRAKSPVHKFKYQLPTSFFEAVDDARVEAGYDILPRFHHLSVSPSSHHETSSSSSSHRSKKHHHHHHHSHRQTGLKHPHSSSTSHNDKDSPKKVRFQRTTRKHSHHHKDTGPSSSTSSSSHRTISKASHSLLNKTKSFSSIRSSDN